MKAQTRIGIWGTSLALLALTAAASAVDAKQRPKMEHNAFLRKPAFTTKQLTDEIHSDPIVLRRYEKHFQIGEKGLVEYMAGLRLRPLTETKRYLVYNVDGNLRIQKRLLTLRRGTLVFVDSKGKPIMKRSCGNPMVSYIPPRGETSNNFAPTKPVELAMVPEPDTFSEAAQPPAFLDTPPLDGIVAPGTPFGPPAPPFAAAGFPPLWPLLGIPIVIGLVGGGDHGGNNPPEPVPEPTGIVALIAGGTALLARRRRKA
ncbi:hypothetical protein BH11ARM2_BH11ARM2_00840 [soil metagenome]